MSDSRSPLNKTIDFDLEAGREYLGRCLCVDGITDGIQDCVIVGDCLAALEKLPDKKYSLLVADPPYNMDKDFGVNRFRRMTDEEYEAFTEKWVSAAKRCLADNASVYVCCDWECSSVVERVLKRHFTVRNRITWQREKGRAAGSNWKNSCEDIWFATVSDDYTFNAEAVKLRRRVIAPYRQDGAARGWDEKTGMRDTAPSNFWDDITVPFWSMSENTAHPTQKSEKLLARLILASSNEGDSVLDPFMGSGSTCVTAQKLGRHFTGIEINPLYCAWAQKRLENAKTDSSIQGYADGVFWERNTASMQGKGNK